MSEWSYTPLAELLTPGSDISYGIVQPGTHDDDGVPILRVSDIRNGRIDVTQPLRVSPGIESAHARTRLKGGELLLTLVGTVGETAVVPMELSGWNVARAVAVIPVHEDVGAYWLRLALTAPIAQEMIRGRQNTTVQATLNLKDVAQLPILLPAPDERAAIAKIIGDLDDKIELNRRMNETLEAMARAIFQSWFVDFDPVRAKASGESADSICQRLGLTPELLALFPDSFEDSELGEVPKGWNTKYFSEAITINPTRTLKKGVVAPYLDMANMPTASARAREIVEREFGSGMKFQNGDTLVARITPCLENGKTCFVDFLKDGQVGWGSTEYIVLRPNSPLPPEFGYFLARTEKFRDHAIANMTGTSGRQRVPASAFKDVRLVIPGAEIVKAFGAFAQATMKSMRSRDAESQTLTVMRDALLPKLLSGELNRIVEMTQVEVMA